MKLGEVQAESPEAAEKLSELTKADKAVRETLANWGTAAERFVAGKLNKGQLADQEKVPGPFQIGSLAAQWPSLSPCCVPSNRDPVWTTEEWDIIAGHQGEGGRVARQNGRRPLLALNAECEVTA